MRQPFRGVGGKMIHVVKLVLIKNSSDQDIVCNRSFHELCPVRDIRFKAAAEVIQNNYGLTTLQTVIRYMTSKKPGSPRNQRVF